MSRSYQGGIELLVLAGGLSSRMGVPKHLLPHIDGRPVYKHTIDALHFTCPLNSSIYISLRNESQLSDLQLAIGSPQIKPLYDGHSDSSQGPAAGLLAAHKHLPDSVWLVVGCDYPLLTSDALQQLLREYEPPVTCFRNLEGYADPLLGIWSPEALTKLERNVGEGRSGPSSVVQSMGGKTVEPMDFKWTEGANTPKQWANLMETAEAAGYKGIRDTDRIFQYLCR